MRIRKITNALTFSAVLFAIFVLPASAQLDKLMNTTPQQRADAQTAFMQSKLALTADQAPQIAALNLKYAQKMEPIIKGSSGSLMKMHQMSGVNNEKETELKQILSADQFQKYLASKEEMREKVVEKIEEKAAGGGQ